MNEGTPGAGRPPQPKGGFAGTVGSLPLVDLLQVEAMNRFSGLVSVSFDGQTGNLYFAEGEIVHAEAPGLAGEPAVRAVLEWPEGSFELVPNTTTLKRTITKGFNHLLLDSHRAIDEARRDSPRSPPAPRPSAPQPTEPRSSVLDQIKAIKGVSGLVRFGRDGRPWGDESPAAEALAAKGLYAALTHGGQLAATLGLGTLYSVVVSTEADAFILVHNGGNHLCVSVTPGTPLGPIESQLKALLGRAGGSR